MMTKQSNLFLRYWCGLNSPHQPHQPHHSNFLSDHVLTALSPYTFVLGGNLKDNPIYWLAGRTEKSLLGRNPKNTHYRQVWEDDSWSILRTFLAKGVERNEPIFLSASVPISTKTRKTLDLETILIPVDMSSLEMKAFIGITVPGDICPIDELAPAGRRKIKWAGFVFELEARASAKIIEFPCRLRSQ